MTEPSRLLSGRRGMSRPEKEAILEGVLARVAPRPRWRYRLAIGAVAACGAAMGVFVLRPAERPAPPDELTARGGALAAGFEVTCVPGPCAAGSKLVFDITSTGGAAYFAAFARHGDQRIWYFPSTPEARSRPLPRDGGVLDTGIVLGAEHAPGSYAIEGVFSAAPLDRAAVRAVIEHGGTTVTRQVVVR
jgi:hypothetical protein